MIAPQLSRPSPARSRNLAAVRPGEDVRIRRIYFDTVRHRCAELGIREGDELRCLRRTGHEVVVQFPECHTAALEFRYARFVELEERGRGTHPSALRTVDGMPDGPVGRRPGGRSRQLSDR